MAATTRGIIYIVTGQDFINEALQSAVTVKRHMPDLPITLISDQPCGAAEFERHIPIENPQHGPRDKIRNIHRSPYDETLYLDSDTHLVEDIRPVFELLQRFDLAASLSPYRAQYRLTGVPECFPEFNSGVFLFRKNEGTSSLFKQWAEFYEADAAQSVHWLLPEGSRLYKKAIPNQPSLRKAIYESGLRLATLPPEYNCRLNFPGSLHTGVKVIHGRAASLEKVADSLNGKTLPRVHLMRWGRLKVLDSDMPAEQNVIARTRWSLHQHGLFKTLTSTLGSLVGLVRRKS